ncbi:hypothetical protein J3459_010700 [Metarhizium acridum]|nr:hypothetical protein J3459_010700 [Metarhizium acridum]
MGEELSDSPIADEDMLRDFMRFAVESPVQKIVQQVREKDILEDRYSIGRGIIFASYPSAISDVNLRVDSQVNTVLQVPANQELDSDQLRPDRICIYKAESEDGSLEQRKLIFIAEYKPPHKLTKEQLRTGLQPMDIYKDIVNHPTIPSQQNKRAYFRYCAKKLTAAAVTQAYHYMIEGGVSYGIMSNGEATVFLKVDWSNPGTLLYHLAEPKSEVPAHHPDGFISCSAVGQYLSFTLLALSQHHQHGERGQEERETVKKNLQRWKYNIDQMLLDMSPDNHKPRSPVDPDFSRPKTYSNVDRSPFLAYNLRRREGDEPARGPARRRSPPSSDDEAEENAPDSPSPAVRRTRSRGRATRGRGARGRQNTSQSRGAASSRNSTRGEQYCTQKCLIGLVNGDFLDMRCPNVSRHMGNGPAPSGMKVKTYHPVNHATWLELLREQWKKSLDDGITSLHISGASGALFQVTLLRYGYTFIGKGTPAPLIKRLENEAGIYKRLKHMQGTSIPVFLGAVDLRPMNKIYYYDHRVYIVHVTFFSWGGRTLSSLELPSGLSKRLTDGACQSIRAMHSKGVVHNDIRQPNMLYNPDTKRIMIIDFDRARVVETSRHEHSRTKPGDEAEIQHAKYILSREKGCSVK